MVLPDIQTPCAIRVAGHGPNGSSPPPHICDKSVGSLCPSYMHKCGPSSQKSGPEGKKNSENGHIMAIFEPSGDGLWAKKIPNVNIYWHPWFGLLGNTFGCLEVSFIDKPLLSLTWCFRGSSSSFRKTQNKLMMGRGRSGHGCITGGIIGL